MKRFLFLLVAVSAVALSGCDTLRQFTQERYTRNNNRGNSWLSDQLLPAEINIAGTWNSDAWGESFFAQNDRTIRGHLGDYPVEGVVSGRKAYLIASENGWQYYSVILEMPAPNILLGYYSRDIPYQSTSRRDLRLDRKW